MSYAKLRADGIDMTFFKARSALGRRVAGHDIPPDDLQPCTTAVHQGEVWANRPSVLYSVTTNGSTAYVCRYCLERLAHARLTGDTETEQALLDLARPHREALGVLIDDAGHLTSSESLAELHWFARLLGLRPEWFQNGRHAHYDVTSSGLRTKATRLGARLVNPGRVAEAARELAKEADRSL